MEAIIKTTDLINKSIKLWDWHTSDDVLDRLLNI